MIRLNFEIKTKLLVAGLALVTTLIVAGAIWPTARDIYGINRDTIDLKTYLEKKYKSTLDLRQSAQQIGEIEKQAAIFSRALYRRGDELRLITFLEDTAARHNLTQKIEAPDLGQTVSQTIQLSLALEGQYQDILRYLSDLESSDYFLNTTRLRVNETGGRPADNQIKSPVSLQIDLQLYVSE